MRTSFSKIARSRNVSCLSIFVAALLGAQEVAGQKEPPSSLGFTVEELERLPPPGPNPYLSLLPAEAEPDWAYWQARMTLQGARRRQTLARTATKAPPVTLSETEPVGAFGLNDLTLFGEPLTGIGSRTGENPRALVSGRVQPLPVSLAPASEPDGAISLARPLAVGDGEMVSVAGTIGDGSFGGSGPTPSGDFDFYSVAARAKQRLEVSVTTPFPLADLDPVVAVYSSSGQLVAINDDLLASGFVTTFDCLLGFLTPQDDTYYVVVGGYHAGLEEEEMFPADLTDPASGRGAGSEGTYEIAVALDFSPPADVDHFRFEARAGDVVGATLFGSARRVALWNLAGELLVSSNGNDLSALYGEGSPLPGGGLATIAYVIDTPGTYSVAADRPSTFSNGAYTLELGIHRTPLDREPLAARQILFVDFDGATIEAPHFGFPPGASATLSPLASFLDRWGIPASQEGRLVAGVLAILEEKLSLDLRSRGANGDFRASGIPGEFDIEIRNSREHADPFGLPNVSRVIVGGTIDELGFATIGLAESIDVGNFAGGECALVLLDLLSAPADDPNSLNGIPRAAGRSIFDLVALAVGTIVAHEAGHLFSNFHTARDQGPANVMDRGGDLPHLLGIGGDGIWGNGDDLEVDFGADVYEPAEVFTGVEETLDAISFSLPASGSRPAVAVAPARVDFGAVPAGGSALGTLAVSNEGTAPLTVGLTEVVGGGGELSITAGAAPFVLLPLESRLLEVLFEPASPGYREASLRISTDDPNDPTVDVALVGQEGVPEGAATPSAVDFGELVYPTDAVPSAIVEVTNSGIGELRVEALALSGGDPLRFSLAAGSGPFVLPGGARRQIGVSFTPSGHVGAMTSRLRLATNDTAGILEVLLEGRAVGPDIDVEPPSPFVFGGTRPGTSLFRLFRMMNEGSLDLEVSSSTILTENGQEFVISSGGAAFVVAPREHHFVRVDFTPASAGLKTAILRLGTNDPNEALVDVELFGVGIEPLLVLAPAAFDFGTVEPGATTTGGLAVKNDGNATLTVESLALAGGSAPDFEIVSNWAPSTLRPETERLLEIRFTPRFEGPRATVLRITSDDPSRPVLDVPLIGLGGFPAEIPTLSGSALSALALALVGCGIWRIRRRH